MRWRTYQLISIVILWGFLEVRRLDVVVGNWRHVMDVDIPHLWLRMVLLVGEASLRIP